MYNERVLIFIIRLLGGITMENIKFEQKGFIGIITISRPSALNALNSQTLSELESTVDAVSADTLRCLIITGDGPKSFVAGADIAEMKDLDQKGAAKFSTLGNRVFRKIEKLPIPVIAAVNGFALGGGCELSMCCDIRIASENAVFAQPETSLGITPGFGGTQRLARIIGLSKAKMMLYTCKKIKAPEALAMGLVDEVCAPEELMVKAEELATKISLNAPYAVRASKAAVNKGMQQDIDSALDTEIDEFSGCFNTVDQKNAMTAFCEKRKPDPFQNK